MTQQLYVIKADPGPVKLGIAGNPQARLRGMRTSVFVPLTLEYVAECRTGDAKEIEGCAHGILKDRRVRGEWFDVTVGEAVDAIGRAAVQLGYEIGEIKPEPDYTLTIYVSDEWLEDLDAWRGKQPGIPSRTAAIKLLVEGQVEQALSSKR